MENAEIQVPVGAGAPEGSALPVPVGEADLAGRATSAPEGSALPVPLPQDVVAVADWMRVPPEIQREIQILREEFARIVPGQTNVTQACESIAARLGYCRGYTAETVRKKYYAYRKAGGDRRVLVDRVRARLRKVKSLPEPFIEFWRALCEEYQRKDKPAYRALLHIWRTHRHPISKKFFNALPGYVTWPAMGETGKHPTGWSYGNLNSYSPTGFEKALVRIGRAAAASHRPLVYTSRAGLWVGSHYLIDDLWHDNFVNVLDTGKSGRPLEFGMMDLYSACKFAWGMRVRTENLATGKMEVLKESQMRCLLASALAQDGYSERGTIIIAEHGMAAVPDWMEKLLYDLSGGKIITRRSGMDGAFDALGIYEGRGKGNFRFKAAYESLHNLVHNEFASLPAQTGMSVERRPEGLHGLLNDNDALLMAMIGLRVEQPDLAELLQLPMLEFGQFLALAMALYDRINSRTEHALEGWRANVIPVRLGDRWRFRRMSPKEVWQRGRGELRKFCPAAIAAILGPDLGVTRKIRGAVTELQDKVVDTDPMMFDTHALSAGEYRLVLNPFLPDRLFVFDTAGRFVAACPRAVRLCPLNVDGVRERYRETKRIEAELSKGVRARGAAQVREAIARARNNIAVLAEAKADRAAKGNTLDRQEASRVNDCTDDLLAREAEVTNQDDSSW
jgi:hypothetical protein